MAFVQHLSALSRRALWLGVVALTVVALLSPAPVHSAGYVVGPNDELTLQVFEDSELNVTRRIAADGSIALPLAGAVAVAGMTLDEVRTAIQSALERNYLQRATVEVTVSEYRSQPVNIIGAVRQPGTQYLDGRWNVFQAITAAGGLDEGHGGVAKILRRSKDGRLVDQLEIDLDELMVRGDQIRNVTVFAHDVISIPAIREITVYFLGEVMVQGAVTVKARDQVTLLTAIAKAGGLTDRASSRITIKRDVGGTTRSEIVANFQRVLAGTEPDIELEDGDLIVVKESFL